MKRLIIVRHGNTFTKDQTPTRVGAHTDLPLVEENRARSAGKYLRELNIIPDKACAAPLKRTMQTAGLILDELGEPAKSLDIIPLREFTEVDYGPDENKTEPEVCLRLGKLAAPSASLSTEEYIEIGKTIIKIWDNEAIAPPGWKVDVNQIIESWKNLAASVKDGETVLICSSNGIIRFAPYLLGIPYADFSKDNSLKVTTGGLCLFECESGSDSWTSPLWNFSPYNYYKQQN